METIKGILVDPYSETVKEVEVKQNEQGGCLAGIKEHIECLIVDAAGFGDDNDVWLDDEGLFNNDRFFHSEKYAPHHILAGKCIILGADHVRGETIATTLSVDDVKNNIKFLSRTQAGALAEKLGI